MYIYIYIYIYKTISRFLMVKVLISTNMKLGFNISFWPYLNES